MNVCRSRPELDPDSGLLNWPVMVMYPESAQQDAIEAFCEEDTIADHLDMVRFSVSNEFEISSVYISLSSTGP